MWYQTEEVNLERERPGIQKNGDLPHVSGEARSLEGGSKAREKVQLGAQNRNLRKGASKKKRVDV